LLFFSGCGIWTDFKTYFNTYYNAKVIFEEAEEKLLLEKNELFPFEEKPIPKNLIDSFNKVIEKTSSILQHNKESDLVDEALLMTGKSFYYQQNYSRALRKFNELSAMVDSDLALENKLWIGKTRLQMRDFEKGLDILNRVKEEATKNDEDEILIEMYRSKIGYLIYAEELELSIAEMNEFFNTEIDDELKAEVLFEMGRLYKLNKDYESAEKVFAQVENYSPSFDVDFSSKFEVATLQGELGHVDESLELLKNLRDEDKFIDNWGEIDLEIGKIFYDRNEIEDALEKFTIVDTTYKKTESAGIAGFYRGEILENTYHDYDSALTFYKVASTSLAPPSIRSAAQKKSRLLDQYIIYHKKLSELKQQFIYLTDENAYREDSLDYVERLRQDSLKFEESNTNISNDRGRKPQFVPKYKQPVRPTIGIDSIKVLNSKTHFELANLLFSEFDDPDSAYYYYNLSLNEHPENPNEAQTYFAIGNYYLIKEEKAKADSMFTIIYDKFQFDPIRNEAAKQIGKPLYDFDKDPVEDEYAKAETIYYSKNYNKAIESLFDIYENHPKSIYASKSLYTIGYILENDLDKPDSAVSIYTLLQDNFRTSEYAKAIQVKLTGYKQEEIKSKLKEEEANKSISEPESSIPEKTKVSKTDTPTMDINKTENPAIIESEEGTKKLIEESEDTLKVIENYAKVESEQIKEDSSATLLENQNIDLPKVVPLEKRAEEKTFIAVSQDIYKNDEGYYVQVSSWKNKDIADSEVQKLLEKKYNAFLHETYVESKKANYYRVKVGPVDSFQAAKNIRAKLNKY
jgi:tetratricopeptide (TPR) repeat protein